MQFLDFQFIIESHRLLILKFGGLSGIRDITLLESAVVYPQFMYELGVITGEYQLAAALAYRLIKNHPFVDGNKRIGAHALVTFLRVNGMPCAISPQELYELTMNIAESKISEDELARMLRE